MRSGGIVSEFFADYLSCRSQRVKSGKVVSGEMFVKHGVPQGTVI